MTQFVYTFLIHLSGSKTDQLFKESQVPHFLAHFWSTLKWMKRVFHHLTCLDEFYCRWLENSVIVSFHFQLSKMKALYFHVLKWIKRPMKIGYNWISYKISWMLKLASSFQATIGPGSSFWTKSSGPFFVSFLLQLFLWIFS